MSIGTGIFSLSAALKARVFGVRSGRRPVREQAGAAAESGSPPPGGHKGGSRSALWLALLLCLNLIGYSTVYYQRTTGLFTKAATLCPITDGGSGDDDQTANGTITVSTTKTWPATGAASINCGGRSIHITGTGTLILTGNPGEGEAPALDVDNLIIDNGGRLTVDGDGCQGGTANGNGPDVRNVCGNGSGHFGYGRGASAVGAGGTGGGYGGSGVSGATSDLEAGGTFGSAVEPVMFGASGGASGAAIGGAGGGALSLFVSGALTLNGAISANGLDGSPSSANTASGGGSGGSLLIRAATINGATGLFQARGGNGGTGGGSGGGGRIAVIYANGDFNFTADALDVSGGRNSGATSAGEKGTVYLADDHGTPNLASDDDVRVFHGFTYDNTDHVVANWTVDPSATNQYCSAGIDAAATPSIQASGNITLAGSFVCALPVASFDISAGKELKLLPETRVNIASAAKFSAGTSFSLGAGTAIKQSRSGANLEFDIPGGNNQVWDGIYVDVADQGKLLIYSPIAITLANNSVVRGSVNWTGLTDLNIDLGSLISADAKGCSAGAEGPDENNACGSGAGHFGSGQGGSGGAAGAGHGGSGGRGSSAALAAGGAYDSLMGPFLFGAAGGASGSVNGGVGGGTIRLSISGLLTLNGNLSANGASGGIAASDAASGGGSGGSISVTATNYFCGTGSMAAGGGSGGGNTAVGGGGGSGGRVSVDYFNDSSVICPLSALQAANVVPGGRSGGSGSSDGSVGTLYVGLGNPIPSLTSLRLSADPADAGQTILSVSGRNFLSGSVIRVGSAAMATSYENDEHLNAKLLTSDLSGLAGQPVSVFNPAPGGGSSNSLSLPAVDASGSAQSAVAPPPSSSPSPSSPPPSSPANPPETAPPPANPPAEVAGNPVPVLTGISPSSKTVGSQQFVLVLNGSNFLPSAVVRLNGVDRVTSFVSPNQLTVAILAADLSAVGDRTINVFNPAPGGGISSGLALKVVASSSPAAPSAGQTPSEPAGNPVPTMTSISPWSKPAGSQQFNLTVNGTNFLSASVVRWNGAARATSYVGPTQLSVVVTAADLAVYGDYQLTVLNPAPGGGVSNPEIFTVTDISQPSGGSGAPAGNPLPTLVSITPSQKPAGSAEFTITVGGVDFQPNSIVRWNGAARATSYVSPTQLTAIIPASDLIVAGDRPITVYTPVPGGGTSETLIFIVTYVSSGGGGGGSSGSGGGGNPPPTSTAVITSVNYLPTPPFVTDTVTIGGAATDVIGISKIELYLDGTGAANLQKTCDFDPTVSPAACSMNVGTLAYGPHVTTVTAYDSLGLPVSESQTFRVIMMTLNNSASLSSLRVGETNVEFGVSFTLQNTLSGLLTVTLPPEFTVLQEGLAGKSSPCLSNFGHTAHTLTAMKTGCFGPITLGGARVNNPVEHGLYFIRWVNEDEGWVPVIIIDPDINVTARIDETMSFDVALDTGNTNCNAAGGGVDNQTVDIGNIDTSATPGNKSICLLLDTNALHGVIVQMKDQGDGSDPGLYSSSAGKLVAATAGATGGSAEKYGVCVQSVGVISTTPASDFSYVAGFRNASCASGTNGSSIISRAFQTIASGTNALDGDGYKTVELHVNASRASTTPTASDYADTLTFRATSTF